MKILFAVRSIFPDVYGGSSRFNKHLITELGKREELTLTVVSPSKTIHFENYRNINEVYIEYGKNIRRYSKNIDCFLKDKRFDIIFSDGLSLYYCKNINEARVVFHHHGYHMFQKQYFSHLLFESPKEFFSEFAFYFIRRYTVKKFARKASYSISLGSGISNILHKKFKLNRGKIIEIPNAVFLDESIVRFEDKEKNSFLFVGSLCFRKGVSFLADALKKTNENFKFYFVGKGPLYKKLQKDFEHDSRVEVLGRISDNALFDLYAKTECFCFPSLQEGMPTVILEAMAKGLPIITTDIGAVKDMIDNNGFLVKKASTNSILEAILKFISLSQSEKKKLSENSRKIIEKKFTWNIVAEHYYDFFKKIVGE